MRNYLTKLLYQMPTTVTHLGASKGQWEETAHLDSAGAALQPATATAGMPVFKGWAGRAAEMGAVEKEAAHLLAVHAGN